MLTSNDICKKYGIDQRTLRKWVRQGCPVTRKKPPKGKGGPARLSFAVRKVDAWAAAHDKMPGGPDKKNGKGKEKYEPFTGQGETDKKRRANLKKEGILGAINRLRAIERATFADLVAARDERRELTVINAKEKLYIEAHEALRKTEKEMPGILEHRGESIPMETVLKEQARIDMAIKTELLALPQKLAVDLSEIDDPADIQELMEKQIDDCLRHIASGKALSGKPSK